MYCFRLIFIRFGMTSLCEKLLRLDLVSLRSFRPPLWRRYLSTSFLQFRRNRQACLAAAVDPSQPFHGLQASSIKHQASDEKAGCADWGAMWRARRSCSAVRRRLRPVVELMLVMILLETVRTRIFKVAGMRGRGRTRLSMAAHRHCALPTNRSCSSERKMGMHCMLIRLQTR